MRPVKNGFSLLEALTALVILSLVFTVVWDWFGVAVKSTRSIEQTLALPRIFSQFYTNLELESLIENRQGRFTIGDYDVDWHATVARQSDKEGRRRQPAWIVTLFDIKGVIRYQQKELRSFQTQAYRQWPDPNYIPPPQY